MSTDQTPEPAWWPPQEGDEAILTTPQGRVLLTRGARHWTEAERPGVFIPDVGIRELIRRGEATPVHRDT